MSQPSKAGIRCLEWDEWEYLANYAAPLTFSAPPVWSYTIDMEGHMRFPNGECVYWCLACKRGR